MQLPDNIAICWPIFNASNGTFAKPHDVTCQCSSLVRKDVFHLQNARNISTLFNPCHQPAALESKS